MDPAGQTASLCYRKKKKIISIPDYDVQWIAVCLLGVSRLRWSVRFQARVRNNRRGAFWSKVVRWLPEGSIQFL